MRNLFLSLFFLMSCNSCFAAAKDLVAPPLTISAPKTNLHSITHAPKTVITRSDISDTGATSLAQALQELGGIQLQDTTGNGSQVLLSMRGFGANASSNTLLLINGIPITNPYLAPPDLNIIPLQDIELIEVTSGSESVLYGDQAVGGIINIVTAKPTKQNIVLSCAGGSYNQRTCSGSLQKKWRQFNVGLDALTTHSDNYRAHNNYDQNLVSGKVDYLYQTGKTFFNFQIANERMLYPGALTATQVAANRRQAKNYTDFFRDWNGIFHLQNKQQLGSIWRLETDMARREMHGDGVLMSSFTQSRVIHYLKPQLIGMLGKTLVTSGVDFENDTYHLQSAYGTTVDSEQKYGLYGVANYPYSSRISFSIGARGALQNNHLFSQQTTNNQNKALATTLGAIWQIKPSVKAYLRRAENFRFPKADENASTPIGVDGLKTQRGVSYETGMTWEWKKVVSKLGIYQLNLRDEITFDPTQTILQPFGADRNLDPTTRYGFSLAEKYLLTDKLTLDGQYNLASARFQSGINSGNRIPLVSENIFHAGLNYKVTPRWSLYSEAIYTGNQYAANDDANVTGIMGGYTVYNFNLRYQLLHFSAALRVNNLLNKYYYFYTVYQPSMQSEFYYPAPGRNLLFTLKYVFD